MKKFNEWMKIKESGYDSSDGWNKTIEDFSNEIKDTAWLHLYDVFKQMQQNNSNNEDLQKLHFALLKSGQSKNMNYLNDVWVKYGS